MYQLSASETRMSEMATFQAKELRIQEETHKHALAAARREGLAEATQQSHKAIAAAGHEAKAARTETEKAWEESEAMLKRATAAESARGLLQVMKG